MHNVQCTLHMEMLLRSTDGQEDIGGPVFSWRTSKSPPDKHIEISHTFGFKIPLRDLGDTPNEYVLRCISNQSKHNTSYLLCKD